MTISEIINGIENPHGGWRNAMESARTPHERAAAYYWGAVCAASRGATWDRAIDACRAAEVGTEVLGNGRWPKLDRLREIIEGAGS